MPLNPAQGGVRLGEKTREEPRCYSLRIDARIPADHLLRVIDQHVDFSFLRPQGQPLSSHTGRPALDPEGLGRRLLVGDLFGIPSARRLCQEGQMPLGSRWFVGLSRPDPVPDHSTFSKNRHGRVHESRV